MLNLSKHTKSKPKPTLNCKNCSCVCVYHCVQLSYTTQHRTVLIIFPLILQTIIIAQTMSTEKKEKSVAWKNNRTSGQRNYTKGRISAAHARQFLYFTMGCPSPPSKLLLPWRIWTPSGIWFLEPTRVYNPNCISIGSAVFVELTIMTDQQTMLLHL